MEQIILEIIKGSLIGCFIVEFPLFAVIPSIIIDYFKIKNDLIKFIIEKPFNCYKCAAFWSTLILTGNIFLAISASFIMKLYDQKLNSVEL